jgi:hypothetical protein
VKPGRANWRSSDDQTSRRGALAGRDCVHLAHTRGRSRVARGNVVKLGMPTLASAKGAVPYVDVSGFEPRTIGWSQ